jgi:predicted alpha/beta-fold hydrolase
MIIKNLFDQPANSLSKVEKSRTRETMSADSRVTFQASALKDFRDAVGAVTSWVSYEAPVWLPGGQLQTIYAYYLRQPSTFAYRRERWEMPDSDFIDLDWLDHIVDSTRLVVLFHGLEGCSRSPTR